MNISEFAKEAGVSKSAVSRYFNDGYLSGNKRMLIEEAIQRTGYSPGTAAHSVKTRVTKLIGVIIPKLSSESCSRVAEGISNVLNSEGYELLLVNTSNDCEKEISSLELFRKSRVDGVILLATVFTDLHKTLLKKMRVPTVIVGQQLQGFNCVCYDDEGASYDLTRLMLSKGAKKPGFIGVTMRDMAAGKARWDGFRRALEESSVEIPKKFTETAEFTMDSGYEKAKKMLSSRDIPDCLFCATDTIALGAMLYCREAGIDIPGDMMIASVGDTKAGKVAYTPLTTAHFHYKTAGIDAAQMLLHELKRGDDSICRTLRIDYELVERESTMKLCETN